MRTTLALAFALALGACGAPRPAPPPPAREPIAPDAGAAAAPTATDDAGPDDPDRARNEKKIARTLATVSRLRGLAAKRDVPGRTLERHALVEAVKEKALREYPAEAIKREGLVLQLFGFAPKGFDYLSEMMRLLEAQLEGFYDPKTGTMFLAGDLRGEQARATLAHELVHALQDQHWDLKKRSTYRPGQGDQTMALAALAEGDATSLMLDFVMSAKGADALALPDEALAEMMRSGIAVGQAKDVPHVLRTSLVAPYVEGIQFIHALRRRGGWPAVDAAWASPPTTTEQILHPEKYAAKEPPLSVSAPAAPSGSGFTKEDEDSYGELGLSLMFGEWMTDDDARVAASGWGGDRASVLRRGEELAVVVHVRFDEAPGKTKDAFAQRAFTSLERAFKGKHGATSRAGFSCAERKDLGPLGVYVAGRELVLVVGPGKPGAGNASPGCAAARAWAVEVAKAP